MKKAARSVTLRSGDLASSVVKLKNCRHFFGASVTVITRGRDGTETSVLGLSVAFGSLLKGT